MGVTPTPTNSRGSPPSSPTGGFLNPLLMPVPRALRYSYLPLKGVLSLSLTESAAITICSLAAVVVPLTTKFD